VILGKDSEGRQHRKWVRSFQEGRARSAAARSAAGESTITTFIAKKDLDYVLSLLYKLLCVAKSQGWRRGRWFSPALINPPAAAGDTDAVLASFETLQL
jgi:hypothetical protein